MKTRRPRMTSRRPRMTRQLASRLRNYMCMISEEWEWEPGEAAQWQNDLDWLWRMDEWFEEKHIQAKARRVGMAELRAARGDEK